ncbi:murein L,D-transpeptidase catalytic domain family protein [Kaistella polysaccharea]|uniref:murein L,D-transpeptidase catalytic domain family protein n=1 Tax=Kaistella polysaccharea TaxID=2878534 RepID=UPI001CF26EF6|nr:murein L,D-transpeptidase catalytic domain family protein [Kaistella polysaccharea]
MQKVLLSLLTVLFLSTSFYKIESNKEKQTPEILKTNPQNLIPKASFKNSAAVAEEIYNSISFTDMSTLKSEVFSKAYLGFENLKKEGKLNQDSNLLTICDFSLSSSEKRLWVIDVAEKKVLYNSLVAHGKNTGEEFAQNFSNTESSYQSSLGFYITEGSYNGSNGYSLKLIGMDNGYNDAAFQRAIVMHGADYVSENFIKSQKRLGRSWGCPAVPRELAKPIINTIKDKNCLFIYYPDEQYLSTSKWLKVDQNS